MKKDNLIRSACAAVLCAAMAASVSGCSEAPPAEDSSAQTAEETSQLEVTTSDETGAEELDSSPETVTETEEPEVVPEEDAPEETETEERVLPDLSFLYGSPNKVVIDARIFDTKTFRPEDENDPAFSTAEVDIIDTGSSYLLGLYSVNYFFGISSEDYQDFIGRAVVDDGSTQDEEGKQTFNFKIVPDNNVLSCMGEDFTLTAYSRNDMGRGTAEFVGEDGESYYIYNDISSLIDDLTNEAYFKLVDENGQDGYRELLFDEGAYIEIPYAAAEGTGMAQFAQGSPDIDSGNPGGHYYFQFDAEGNITQIQGW